MKKSINFFLPCFILFILSCNKAPQTTPDNFPSLEQDVLDGFTHDVAISQYLDLKISAFAFNEAIQNLNSNATEANIAVSRNAWTVMHSVWESCEGFYLEKEKKGKIMH